MRLLFITRFIICCLILGINQAAQAISLLRDTEIEATLNEFSTPLIRAAGLEPDHVDIYLVNDPSLNAFVTQGQKIFIHSGLILASDTPNQLKGVIAHETGHIADGRLARSDYDNRSAYGAMLIAAGLGLAAILAGEGTAGALILTGSPQFGALEVLAHTRVSEAVADQYAAQYLAQTGQSGKGLIAFFEKYRVQEILSEARRYPYFRSHPLSSERIDNLREIVNESPYTETADDPEDIYKMNMMKAKLFGFLGAPQLVFSRFPESNQTDPARYARAVAHFKNADLTHALKEIDQLIKKYPENAYFYELKAQILYESGRGSKSLPFIKKARTLQPNEPLLQLAHAQALIEQNDANELKQAEKLLKRALLNEPHNASAWFFLGQAYGRQNRFGLASYATAEQAYAVGDFERARQFARRAQDKLPRHTPQWRRASDIISIANVRLAKKKRRRR